MSPLRHFRIDSSGDMSPETGAAVVAAVVALAAAAVWHVSENATGPEAAAMHGAVRRGGCPEGYVSAPVSGFATNGTMVVGSACVADLGEGR